MTIPVEIVLEILHLILEENLMLPAVGQDASSVLPPDSLICWKRSLKEIIIDKMPWNTKDQSTGTQQGEQDIESLRPRREHCTLKILRRCASQFFNKGCKYT
jgi:hypothetical protein